jgi:hypothetical protein
MTSYNGFVWPKEGLVECPDWNAKSECGNGLHGALWGEGNGSLFNLNDDAVWQVVEIDEWIELDGKVKFPRGNVVHTGTRLSATNFIRENGAKGKVIGSVVVVEHCETAAAGDLGTAISGNYGIASAGDSGTATAGNHGTATAGNHGTAIAGNFGTATSGNYGIARAEHNGTATAGDVGTAIVGNYGTAIVGNYGTAITGCYGTAMAGVNGIIQIKYFVKDRAKIKIGYIGEDGLEPNVKYKLNDNFEFEKC